MHKKFTFGLIALLGVSLFIMGCDDSSDDAEKSTADLAKELVEALGGEGVAEIDPDDATGKTVKLIAAMTGDPKAVTVQAGVTLKTGAIELKATTLAVNGKLELDAAAEPTGNVTVGAGGSIALGADLTIAAGKNLTLTGGPASGATAGAKLTGTGKVVAGATEIVGGTGGWQAVGTGTIAIEAGATGASTVKTVTIAASATTSVLTAGTGATITQLAVANNNLTIGAATTIALGGTTGAALGSIILTNAGTNPGKLSFGGAGAQVTTGNTGGSALAAKAGVFEVDSDTTANKIPVSAYTSSNFVTITGDNDSLDSIVFGAGTAYITGPANASGNPATISAITDCTD
jgi:hypothetical protein